MSAEEHLAVEAKRTTRAGIVHQQPTVHRHNGAGPLGAVRKYEALHVLLEAHQFSEELGRSPWDFAVEIECLRKAGLTNNDFRWLVCKSYVEHARETTLGHEDSRTFRRRRGLIFSRRTCFVLTGPGVDFIRSLLKDQPLPREPFAPVNGDRPSTATELATGNGSHAKPAPRCIPIWDRDRQELRVGGYLVKQFKVPALNQERILAAFEEEGWPVHIDDPLPPQQEQDPKRRLHDTINSLNRKQKHRLIRFMGDGTGQGVRWCLITPGENGDGGPEASD
ncbi:MAG: hypothetical protein HUU20_05750 [Pirellulales bacterium]|nr:hypothetical protein [Pirellulales bacterium]